jgi:hypothetical protein
MVAAVLGSRARNKAFVSRFWWEGLRDMLERANTQSGPASGLEAEAGTEVGSASWPAPTWEQPTS